MSRARDNANTTSRYDAKGDMISASGDNSPARLGVGANNTVLVADNTQTAGTKWSSSLIGLTLTNPSIASISNSGTISLPTSTDTLVGRATTDTLTNKTLSTPVVLGPVERCWVVSSSATGTINLDFLTAGVLYYTSAASANHTLNIRGNSSTTLSSLLAVGDSVTVVWMNTNGATAYFPNTIQIDGSTVTPKWFSGAAPSVGNASSVDVYTFTIIKIASAPSYTVLGSQVKFA